MKLNRDALVLILSAAALAPVAAAGARMPTVADCARACAATDERVGSFTLAGGNAHCVCECKPGWSRKSPGTACERRPAASRPAAVLCQAKLQVTADERAIAQMNFGNDVQTFEMFAGVSKEQKEKFEDKVLGALIDQGLEAGTMAAMSAKSLNPVTVNAAIAKLRENGLQNEAVVAALRTIAAAKDKPAMAEAYKDLVEIVQSAKEGYDTGHEMAEDAKNARLRLLLGVLKVAQGNPTLGVAVTAADFGESLAYLGYISGQVDDLTRVTDNKLAALNGHIARLKGDLAMLREARARWAATRTGAGPKEPDCTPIH